jgi:hypothetical protein
MDGLRRDTRALERSSSASLRRMESSCMRPSLVP